MIEPHHAARLGFTAAFQPNDRAAIERSASRMRELGATHLRVVLCAAELSDDHWVGWMMERLAGELSLLPCLDMSGLTSEHVTHFLHAHGQCFAALELRDTGGDLQEAGACLRAAAESSAMHDTAIVLSLSAVSCASRLRALGALNHVTAIGLLAARDTAASLDDDLQMIADAARQANPRLQLWITQVGCSTWRHEIASQARGFLGALSSAADRIYWRSLNDDCDADPRDEAAHYGIDDASGSPKLLGRLLAGGVAEVERIMASARNYAAPAAAETRPVLVTGGAGFIGANLADRLAADGRHVVIYDALVRPGVERNLRWLERRHGARIEFVLGDLRDEATLGVQAARACAVFHLAGQVAVTTSMVTPLADFDVNARGTLALLETLRRKNPQAPLIFASTNKVYGDLADVALVREGDAYVPQHSQLRAHGIGEARPLCFHTPYGCSKGTADQYVLDYAHSFGLRTAVLRMSCIYGERQLGTEDQGWVAHFLLRAIAGEALTIYGDGRQVRDILHVGDAIDAYMAAWANIDAIRGRAYNLGGGPGNAISLLQLVEYIEVLLGRRIDVEFSAWRPGDQRYFVADTTAIRRDLSLSTPLEWRLGLARLAEHFGADVPTVQVKEAAL